MKKIALSTVALLIAGCAHEIPMGAAFKTPEQLKLNSAAHWDVLAHHEAGLIKKTLINSSRMPVFIKEPDKSYPFAKTYHNLLTSSLAAQGVTIVTQPEFNAATIRYDVDVVKHNANYTENMGLPTPLGHGVYYLAVTALGKGVHDVTTTAIEIVKAPFYAAVDQVKPNYATHVEVVITTQVVLGNQVLNSDSRVYYVERGNLPHYAYHEPEPVPHHYTVSDYQ
ncbi:MAG: hypothetical protein HOP02_14905 [Methylococcaceae bacterium]|nr:hypothetical protein [Methylococcaceae bacterium]